MMNNMNRKNVCNRVSYQNEKWNLYNKKAESECFRMDIQLEANKKIKKVKKETEQIKGGD